MDWTAPDLTLTPGDQGYTTVDITGTQSDGSAQGTTTYYGPTNFTGAPQYPGDPTADAPSNSFAVASPQTVSMLPATSDLSAFFNDAAQLLGAGTAAYQKFAGYARVPIPGTNNSAYVNSTTGLPAGSQAVSGLFNSQAIPPALILAGIAALFLMFNKGR
jgi:hypothetical protein